MLSLQDRETIRNFILFRKESSAWLFLFGGHLEIYLRRGFHIWEREVFFTLDIGNVLISRKSERSKGKFTDLLDFVEPRFNVYVESIQNTRLLPFLKNRGYSFQEYQVVSDAMLIKDPMFKWPDKKYKTLMPGRRDVQSSEASMQDMYL